MAPTTANNKNRHLTVLINRETGKVNTLGPFYGSTGRDLAYEMEEQYRSRTVSTLVIRLNPAAESPADAGVANLYAEPKPVVSVDSNQLAKEIGHVIGSETWAYVLVDQFARQYGYEQAGRTGESRDYKSYAISQTHGEAIRKLAIAYARENDPEHGKWVAP